MAQSARQAVDVRKTVLLVEDDDSLARDLESHMKELGAEILGPATSIAEARELLRGDTRVGLVVLDMRLREKSAYELADWLGKQGIPFVFCSSLEAESLPERFRGAPLLTKPINRMQLERLLSGSWPIEEPRSRTLSNHLLRRLPEEAMRHMRPHMATVPLIAGQLLARSDHPLERMIFPESGVLSHTLSDQKGPVEVGLVGRDGALGLWGIHGLPSPSDSTCQITGFGTAIDTEVVRKAAAKFEGVASLFTRYQYVCTIQCNCTAASNAIDKVETRLARWLLMCADRVGPELPLVHEFISTMLHVRRASVTTALHALEGEGLIKSLRAHVRIRDRKRLIEFAGPFYGPAETAYARYVDKDSAHR